MGFWTSVITLTFEMPRKMEISDKKETVVHEIAALHGSIWMMSPKTNCYYCYKILDINAKKKTFMVHHFNHVSKH